MDKPESIPLSCEDFLVRLANLKAEIAGVPHLLVRFREGDETLIAIDRLTGSTDPLSESIARNAFFDGLEETTHRLQEAAIDALKAIRPARTDLTDAVTAFSTQFHGYTFRP
jgi:hypothetical protein